MDDLRERGNLTKQQQVGLRLYYDLIERMPREEAGEIAAEVGVENFLKIYICIFFIDYLLNFR